MCLRTTMLHEQKQQKKLCYMKSKIAKGPYTKLAKFGRDPIPEPSPILHHHHIIVDVHLFPSSTSSHLFSTLFIFKSV